MTTVERYHYLWDGSESGWVLMRVNRQAVKLVLLFEGAGPDVREVKAIRSVVPAYALLSASEALEKLRGTSSIDLGEFDCREGRRIARACRKLSLEVQEEMQDRSGYLPFNENTKACLVIEDNVLSEQVCQEALSRGLRVRHVEA